MAFEKTTAVCKVAPAGADGVSVTPANSAFTNSAWVQVIAANAIAVDYYVTSITVFAAVNAEFEVEIGTGAGPTAAGYLRGNRTGTNQLPWTLYFPCPVHITANTKLSIRMRKTSTSTTAWNFAVGYYEADPGIPTTTAKTASLPSGAVSQNHTPNATAFASSTWASIGTPDATNGAAIFGIIVNPPVNVQFEIDIGVGGSTPSSALGTYRSRNFGTSAGLWVLDIRPLLDVGTQQVWIRMRKSGTSATDWSFSILFLSKGSGTPTLATVGGLCAPSAAADVAPSNQLTPWADSAWQQLVAASVTTDPAYIMGFSCGGEATAFEVDFGRGAGPTVVGTVRGDALSGSAGGPLYVRLNPPLPAIPAGEAISYRIRKAGTVTTFAVNINYTYDVGAGAATQKPVSGDQIAAASDVAITPNATPWADSAWAVLDKSGPSAVVGAVSVVPGVTGLWYEVDVGESSNSGSSWTVLGTLKGYIGGSTAGIGRMYLPVPVQTTPGVWIGVRMRKSGVSTATWTFATEQTPVPTTATGALTGPVAALSVTSREVIRLSGGPTGPVAELSIAAREVFRASGGVAGAAALAITAREVIRATIDFADPPDSIYGSDEGATVSAESAVTGPPPSIEIVARQVFRASSDFGGPAAELAATATEVLMATMAQVGPVAALSIVARELFVAAVQLEAPPATLTAQALEVFRASGGVAGAVAALQILAAYTAPQPPLEADSLVVIDDPKTSMRKPKVVNEVIRGGRR